MSGHKKRINVLIVGLPLFTQRLQKDLHEFDPKNKYIALDTYYRIWDKVRAFFLIPFVDVVYSINGTLSTSRVFDLAFFFKKRVMMMWVGTDVSKAKKENNKNQKYLHHAEHYCEVEWIQKELEEINISAKIQNFFNFKADVQINNPEGSQLKILAYIGKSREIYYGWNELCEVANQNPHVSFTVVGTDGIGNIPENVKCLGWQKDMNPLFNQTHCTLRFVQHDGLSGFVLESLLRGKQVIYSEPLTHCLYAKNKNDINNHIASLVTRLNNGENLFNQQGRDFVFTHFNTQTILSELINNFEK